MAMSETGWWSRAWGFVAAVAFTVYLGAALYEAVCIAPLWTMAPPASVTAWISSAHRPDPTVLFHPLLAIIVVTTGMAWFTGVLRRGWRRWWLTLALLAAGSVAAVTVQQIFPIEQKLFGGAAGEGRDPAVLVALTGDWIRAAALRLAALLVGAWAANRAQVSGALADRVAKAAARAAALEGEKAESGDFAFGDEDDDDDLRIEEEAITPRQRWLGSLPGRRRTAKK